MPDFLDAVRHHLPSLQNDASRETLGHENNINSPLGELDLGGEAIQLSVSSWDDYNPIGAVSEENTVAASSLSKELGVEALAFYKSFRFADHPPFVGRWGIFLIDAGIEAVATNFRMQRPYLRINECYNLATRFLLEHERYHFWIDAWALSVELSSLNRIKKYEYYIREQKYLALTSGDYEESLANYYLFRKLRRWKMSDGRSAASLLRNFLSECPIPYSEFDLQSDARLVKEHILANAVSNGVSTAAAVLLTSDRSAHGVGAIISRNVRPVPVTYPISDISSCPTYVLCLSGYHALARYFEGPDHTEAMRFVTAYLTGRKSRQTDHEYYRIDNGEEIKIPNPHDKTLRGYEFKSFLYKAGLRQPEYRRAREETKIWRKGCPRRSPAKPILE